MFLQQLLQLIMLLEMLIVEFAVIVATLIPANPPKQPLRG
jgi:hypothetical protein